MKKQGISKQDLKMFNLGIIQGKKLFINSMLERGIIPEDKKDKFIIFILSNLN
jgi:hypothetical protein